MIDLPDKFKLDIESKVFDLTPLVIIDNRIRLSTKKVFVEQNFDPLIKKVGSINQSVDASEKKFKISSVNIDLFNIDYSESPSNQTFSEKLFNPSIMNKKVEIYHKSQSGESLGDCLKVYSGFVKDIKERTDFLSIRVEDRAEKTLHRKLPIEYVRDDIDLPDKYKNKRVPMVYGYVNNAPCVYYNIYQSALENGSNKYAITPDSFAIQLIENPKIFDNNIYLNIRKTCYLFSQQSEDTLYETSVKDQFSILSNMILVDKHLNVDTVSQGGTPSNFNSYDATPIAYNLVEVIHKSPVVFSGGTYDLHYSEGGGLGEKRSANVQMFQDTTGNTPSTTVNGSYLDVKDFGEIPEEIADAEYWLFGNQSRVETNLGYDNIYGETIMNFEATEFASENKITQFLPTASGEQPIKGYVTLEYDLEAEVLGIVGNTEFPHLFFRWADQSQEIWNVGSNDEESGGIFKKSSSTTPNTTTSNLSNKIFSITQRELNINSGNWVLQNQSDGFKYLKINNLEVERYAILNDFISYDIYADVYGRVDNVAGSYTGTEQFTLSQRQDYFEGRLNTGMRANQAERLAKRPVARQIKKPVKPTKPPTIKKQKIKTRTKY